MIKLMQLENERIWAEKGVSPFGQNNVFGVPPNMFLNVN